MPKIDPKGAAFMGVVAGLAGFLVIPRIVDADTVDGWIVVLMVTLAGCWPAYVVGGSLSLLVWAFTESWRTLPRLALRAFALSIALAPGLVTGHGFAIVPAVYAFVGYLIDGEPLLAVERGLKPLLFTWIAIAMILGAILVLKSKWWRQTVARAGFQ